jgi:membrane protein DedA with SNARE-associated domain
VSGALGQRVGEHVSDDPLDGVGEDDLAERGRVHGQLGADLEDLGSVAILPSVTPCVPQASSSAGELELAVRLHHHLHGSSVGYVAIGVTAAISWLGIPGPGEPVLLAGGVLASRGRLDLAETLVIAWLGASLGGVGGWLLGRHGGRRLVTFQGPLYGLRLRILSRGEAFFARFGVVAVYFAPSWVAGVSEMPPARFLPAQAIAAVVWVLLVGGGAFVIGPSIIDLVGDLGLVGALVQGAVVAIVAFGEGVRRRHGKAA